MGRGRDRSRTAARCSTSEAPAARESTSRRSTSARATACPTVPTPRRPMRTVFTRGSLPIFDTAVRTPCATTSGQPTNRGSMPGEIPLTQKLGSKERCRLLRFDPPGGFARRLDPLPPGVGVTTKIISLADVVVVFSSSRAVLGELFPKAKHVLAPRGALWVAFPRKSSGFFTDLDESLVRAVGLAAGMTDNKIIALDEIWSALRFVVKESDRLPLPHQSEISLPAA